MKLQTPVAAEKSRIGISYEDRIMVLGSCFADNVGQKMLNAGFDVCVNPFGTLYNPVSLANSVERLRQGRAFTVEDCEEMGAGTGLFCSFSHHTSFARCTREEFLDNANAALERASHFYKNCNKVIVTLGTSWCYRYFENGMTVSNCLKRPAAEFTRYMLDTASAAGELERIVEPGKEYVFTVSPIRHLKDGAHGNQLSKSSLLVAVDSICRRFPDTCGYFPSYEIMMDELRDYRFYAEDMVHPSQQAVDYIWERFMDFALPAGQKEKLLENEKLYKRSLHRPLH